MRLIAERLLPAYQNATYIQDEVIHKPVQLQPPGGGRKHHVYCSPLVPGGLELMDELADAHGLAVDVAGHVAQLPDCECMLIYLTSRTWTSGEQSVAFAAEVHHALDLHVRLLLAHEMPGIQQAQHSVEFGAFFASPPDGTPPSLLRRGIYSQIAVPLKGGPWREASMVLLAEALGEPFHDDDRADELQSRVTRRSRVTMQDWQDGGHEPSVVSPTRNVSQQQRNASYEETRGTSTGGDFGCKPRRTLKGLNASGKLMHTRTVKHLMAGRRSHLEDAEADVRPACAQPSHRRGSVEGPPTCRKSPAVSARGGAAPATALRAGAGTQTALPLRIPAISDLRPAVHLPPPQRLPGPWSSTQPLEGGSACTDIPDGAEDSIDSRGAERSRCTAEPSTSAPSAAAASQVHHAGRRTQIQPKCVTFATPKPAVQLTERGKLLRTRTVKLQQKLQRRSHLMEESPEETIVQTARAPGVLGRLGRGNATRRGTTDSPPSRGKTTRQGNIDSPLALAARCGLSEASAWPGPLASPPPPPAHAEEAYAPPEPPAAHRSPRARQSDTQDVADRTSTSGQRCVPAEVGDRGGRTRVVI